MPPHTRIKITEWTATGRIAYRRQALTGKVILRIHECRDVNTYGLDADNPVSQHTEERFRDATVEDFLVGGVAATLAESLHG